jgi:hypothetical protein
MKQEDIQSHLNPILFLQGSDITHTVKVTYLGKGIYGCRCFLNGVLNSEYRAKGKANIVKEHAILSAAANVDHGVEVETTGEHVNRAADGGCCVSTCSPSSFSVYDTRHPIHQPYQKPIFGSKNTTVEHVNRAADRGFCVSPCSISSFLLEGLRHKDPAVRVMKWLAVTTLIGHIVLIGGSLIYYLLTKP